ncbi:hypothetical protein MchiMG62_23940 [Methanoculleus chikugoensis]|uniref:Uncharacterized protein n=1 Tax=Methanoculleus chikugoensis TaxID=118126 RepID=A0ABN5XKN1_9EURY|nr:hypothetical protein MchiMG62_23940 [Methanoculleus chikugoensis]
MHNNKKSQSGIGSISCTVSPAKGVPGSLPMLFEGRIVYSAALPTETSSNIERRNVRESSLRSSPDLRVLIDVEGV